MRNHHSFVNIVVYVILAILSLTDYLRLSKVQLIILLAVIVYIPEILSKYYQTQSHYLTLLAGLLLVTSFQLIQSITSGLLTIPWIITSTWLSYSAIKKLKLPKPILSDISYLLQYSSILFLPLASGALFLSRLGLQPFDFSHTIIELTAVHFHYTGFSIPLFGYFIIQVLNRYNLDIAAIGLLIGTPLVATGITLGQYFPITGLIAVVIFTSDLIFLSILVIYNHNEFSSKIVYAHIILIPSMILAIYYAYGVAFNIRTISIAEMVLTHGVVNAGIYLPLNIMGWSGNQSKLY